jgi:hypothetical protein
LGRPDLDAAAQVEALRKNLAKAMDQSEIPTINAALVFTADKVEIQGINAPLPALPIKRLKDFMRQKARGDAAPAEAITRVKACLPEA